MKKIICTCILIVSLLISTVGYAQTQLQNFTEYIPNNSKTHTEATEVWEYNVQPDGELTSGHPREDLYSSTEQPHTFKKNVCTLCGYELKNKTITLNTNIYLEGQKLTWTSSSNTSVWTPNSKHYVDGYITTHGKCELTSVTVNGAAHEVDDWFALNSNDYEDNDTINVNFYYEYTDWDTYYNVEVKHVFWDDGEEIYRVDKSFTATPGTYINVPSYSTASRFYFRTSTLPGGIWYLGDFAYLGGQHNSVIGTTNNVNWVGVNDTLIHDNVYITFNYYIIKDAPAPSPSPSPSPTTVIEPTESATAEPEATPTHTPTLTPTPTIEPEATPTPTPVPSTPEPTNTPEPEPELEPEPTPTEEDIIIEEPEPTEEPGEEPLEEEPQEEETIEEEKTIIYVAKSQKEKNSYQFNIVIDITTVQTPLGFGTIGQNSGDCIE